jgi:hypothetical protein
VEKIVETLLKRFSGRKRLWKRLWKDCSKDFLVVKDCGKDCGKDCLSRQDCQKNYRTCQKEFHQIYKSSNLLRRMEDYLLINWQVQEGNDLCMY